MPWRTHTQILCFHVNSYIIEKAKTIGNANKHKSCPPPFRIMSKYLTKMFITQVPREQDFVSARYLILANIYSKVIKDPNNTIEKLGLSEEDWSTLQDLRIVKHFQKRTPGTRIIPRLYNTKQMHEIKMLFFRDAIFKRELQLKTQRVSDSGVPRPKWDFCNTNPILKAQGKSWTIEQKACMTKRLIIFVPRQCPLDMTGKMLP